MTELTKLLDRRCKVRRLIVSITSAAFIVSSVAVAGTGLLSGAKQGSTAYQKVTTLTNSGKARTTKKKTAKRKTDKKKTAKKRTTTKGISG
jgi:hypothetical protein